MAAEEQSIEEALKRIKESMKIDLTTFTQAVVDMREGARQINNVFGQARQRIDEISIAVADAIPRIERLGGSQEDAINTIKEIAEATRKNIIASTEDVEKLYSIGKLIGDDVNDIVKNFTNVGIGFTQVGKQLEDSIKYVQSVGGNVKQVMSSVVENTDKLNRFQFEGGVQGLTKMAAQASILRFDMNETFNLANKVLDPDKAVEIASAFQRLGVSAGNLVDPFQLMNQSINDPQGLQNSLADVAKQFTYFDEKTKTFKINPDGVLKLREMETQTGVSAREMTKLGLAAKEVDTIVSQIKPSIEIPEEDKMYLSNIAKMGEGGEYEVTVDDKTKKIGELTKDEITKLIEVQKKGPKTSEDILRNQLSLTELIRGDVKSIASSVNLGAASTKVVRKEGEGLYRAINAIGGGITKAGAKPEITRDEFDKLINSTGGLVSELKGGKTFGEAMTNFGNKLGVQGEEAQKKLTDLVKEAIGNIDENFRPDASMIEGIVNKLALEPAKKAAGLPQKKTTENQNVNVSGVVTFDIKAPNAITQQELSSYTNSPEFKEYVKKLVDKHFEEMARLKKGQ
jgi:hypothetical protein